ncbi:MAG: hypothetical protein HN580_14590 [Deltaproteobacteria bacterium]|jgi:hypothetical protein|nr:hypothetical protein [Deltaproteobacteria bacterium]MBT4642581.1 hypothetical protein [Deltaproteobacteria bacterium]MBT6503075.1 hypothetical protein [Deltaproteobacteria bacterium]MBT7155483.1 hypothetical protein [Deltaproteobacteria bacterium]MBT7714747.1 hypothetical protein [Deltaproteobacteria bacterium]
MLTSNVDWAWPWWTVVVSLNVIQVVVCFLLARRAFIVPDKTDLVYRTRMVWMGTVFTLVAAYRSVFVSRYFSQMGWFDSIANSVLLIRSFAFFAELSFAGLFALAMLQFNKDLPEQTKKNQSSIATFFKAKSPYFLFICIFIAQFFAYGGLIFKSHFLFAIEETLWSLGFVSILPLAYFQLRRVLAVTDTEVVKQVKMLRDSAILIFAWCVIYCCYGIFYHLPLENWPGALAQLRTGEPAIKTGLVAVKDALWNVNESKEYADWGFGFLLWHSTYFTICVWIALGLIRAPRALVEDIRISSSNLVSRKV